MIFLAWFYCRYKKHFQKYSNKDDLKNKVYWLFDCFAILLLLWPQDCFNYPTSLWTVLS